MNWRKVVAPGLLLAALLLALVFRYGTEATKTYDRNQAKYVRDRWTGRIWVRVYGPTSSTSPFFQERASVTGLYPIWPDIWHPEVERFRLTVAWVVLTGATAAWLGWSLRRRNL